MKLSTIIYGAILLIASIIINIMINKIPTIHTDFGFTGWTSSFLTLAAILIAILLVFNFVYVKEIMMIKKNVEDDVKRIPDFENALAQIKKLDSIKIREEAKKYLEGLNSRNKNDRYSAAQGLGEIGEDLHLEALKKALNKEKNPEVRDAINRAIGKIEGRSKDKK